MVCPAGPGILLLDPDLLKAEPPCVLGKQRRFLLRKIRSRKRKPSVKLFIKEKALSSRGGAKVQNTHSLVKSGYAHGSLRAQILNKKKSLPKGRKRGKPVQLP